MDCMRLSWASFRENRIREEQKEQNKEREMEKALPKYNVLLEKFLADSQKIFFEVGMTQDEIEETTKDIREFLRLINDKPLK
jgi:tRNA splicing ligase